MKRSFCSWVLLSLVVTLSNVWAREDFPEAPAAALTPGDLCQANEANHLRYPERIPYCERAVPVAVKEQIVDLYDRRFGYRIREIGRHQFKIDHYIPLCMGGSNDPINLWPQHLSISDLTDRLEALSCQKMSEGKLRQQQAVRYIRAAKADPRQADQIYRQVDAL